MSVQIPTLKDVAEALNVKLSKVDGLGRNSFYKNDVEIEVQHGPRGYYRAYKTVTVVLKTGHSWVNSNVSRRLKLYDGSSIYYERDKVEPRALTPEEKKALWAKYREVAKVAKANKEISKRGDRERKEKEATQNARLEALDKAKIDPSFSDRLHVDVYKPELTVSLRGMNPEEIVELYRKIEAVVGKDEED